MGMGAGAEILREPHDYAGYARGYPEPAPRPDLPIAVAPPGPAPSL
jgi:hypothetical protein